MPSNKPLDQVTNTKVDEEKTWTATWTLAKPLLTAEQVKNITRKATLMQKVRLLFRPSKYSFDGGSIIRYKQMDGITFVMKRGTHIKKEQL